MPIASIMNVEDLSVTWIETGDDYYCSSTSSSVWVAWWWL
jgi:hypothetical protein